jgi:AcrR family transcriptional regulator
LSTSAANRHERRRQETADRILEAAATLFGERGVAATTVADICERADVARQTFFNHFETKQEVAQALARRGHGFLLEALEQAQREERTTEQRIAYVLRQIHTSASAVGPMHQDLVSEVMRAAFDATDPTDVSASQRAVEKLLRAGRARGEVSRAHALEDQGRLVLGALQFLVFEWTHRPDFPIAERATRMARLLADALAP